MAAAAASFELTAVIGARDDREQRDAGDGATATKSTVVLRLLGVLDRSIKIP